MWGWIVGTRTGRAVAAALAVMAGAAAIYLRGKSQGRDDAEDEAARDALDKSEMMRDANADARRGDIVDRLRRGGF